MANTTESEKAFRGRMGRELAERDSKIEDNRVVPAGYAKLEKLSEGELNLSGWIRPEEGLHVYGKLITTIRRKAPKRTQAEKFLVIELAAPVVGLQLGEDRDAEASEALIETGSRVGLDLRQSLSMLEGRSGKVHIAFIRKEELEDGNTWWRTEVEGNLDPLPQPSNGPVRGF